MHTLMTIVSAATVAVHSLIGCCLHHAHISAEADSHAALAVFAACSAEGSVESAAPSPDTPCPEHSHRHSLCSFLSPQKGAADGNSLDGSFDFAAMGGTIIDLRLAPRLRRQVALAPEPEPLRLHLLHQILLI
jgi:hypothetical protein